MAPQMEACASGRAPTARLGAPPPRPSLRRDAPARRGRAARSSGQGLGPPPSSTPGPAPDPDSSPSPPSPPPGQPQPPPLPSSAAAAPGRPDAYRQAVVRLQSLLAAGGDEDELVGAALTATPPGERLLAEAGVCALLATGVWAACRLIDIDPLAGLLPAGPSAPSLGLGLLAALPLAAAQAALFGWDAGEEDWEARALEAARGLGLQEGEAQFCVDTLLMALDRLRSQAVGQAGVLVSGMNPAQALGLAAAQAAPEALLLFPLFVGGTKKLLSLASEAVGAGPLDARLDSVVAAVVVSIAVATVQYNAAGAQERELLAVQDAALNADRYYRVTGLGRDSAASDAWHAADAFQAVVAAWLYDMEFAATLAGAGSLVSVLGLAALYLHTGSLAAPLTAVCASNAVALLCVKGALGELPRGPD